MKLCLGTVQFGMDYGIQGGHQPEYYKIDSILDYAISHGITTFDTAAAYGEAENILGHYVKHSKRKQKDIKVISKLAENAFENTDKHVWPDIAINNASKSRDSLRIEQLEAYLFHNAFLINDLYAVKAIASVKEREISKKVGVSIYFPEEALKALEYDEIDVIQIPYNVFDRRLDKCGFFHKAKEKGVEVYARSTLLQGLIMMNESELSANMAFARGYLKKYHDICREYNVSSLAGAVGYVNSHEGIDYIVFGVDNISQLHEYIEINDTAISNEMINDLDEVFFNVEEKLVNPVLWN